MSPTKPTSDGRVSRQENSHPYSTIKRTTAASKEKTYEGFPWTYIRSTRSQETASTISETQDSSQTGYPTPPTTSSSSQEESNKRFKRPDTPMPPLISMSGRKVFLDPRSSRFPAPLTAPTRQTPIDSRPLIVRLYDRVFQRKQPAKVNANWEQLRNTDRFIPVATNNLTEDVPSFDAEQWATPVYGEHLAGLYDGKTITSRLHNWICNPKFRKDLKFACSELNDKGIASDCVRHMVLTRSIAQIRDEITTKTRDLHTVQTTLDECDLRLLAARAEDQLTPYMDPAGSRPSSAQGTSASTTNRDPWESSSEGPWGTGSMQVN